MAAHDEEIRPGAEEPGFCLKPVSIFLREAGTILIQTCQILVDTADPAVTGGPGIKIILGGPLLAVYGHNQVTVPGSGHNGSIFQNVCKPVRHICVTASQGVGSKLTELVNFLIEIIQVQFRIPKRLECIDAVVFVCR